MVSRELDKFNYDILNENIPKYVSLFILQLPLRLAAVQQCVQRNLGNTTAVRVCDATLLASVETRNLRKFAIGVSLKTKINRLLVPEIESALSQQNRLVFFFFHFLAAYHVLAEIATVGPTTTKSGFLPQT